MYKFSSANYRTFQRTSNSLLRPTKASGIHTFTGRKWWIHNEEHLIRFANTANTSQNTTICWMARPSKTSMNTLSVVTNTKHGDVQTLRAITKTNTWITLLQKTFLMIISCLHPIFFQPKEPWHQLNSVNKCFELSSLEISVSPSLRTLSSLLCFDMPIRIATFQIVVPWPKPWKRQPRTRGLHWEKNWWKMIQKSVLHWTHGHPAILLHS